MEAYQEYQKLMKELQAELVIIRANKDYALAMEDWSMVEDLDEERDRILKLIYAGF